MLTGTVAMAAIGVVLNTFVLVPLYSSFMPLTEIIKMGQAIFPAIDGTFTFCLYCVGPFNIIKGLIISVVVFIIYKPLSRLINSLDALLQRRKKQRFSKPEINFLVDKQQIQAYNNIRCRKALHHRVEICA